MRDLVFNLDAAPAQGTATLRGVDLLWPPQQAGPAFYEHHRDLCADDAEKKITLSFSARLLGSVAKYYRIIDPDD